MGATGRNRKRSIVTSISYRLNTWMQEIAERRRVTWLKMQGMQLGANSKIGKIRVQVPEQVQIGSNCKLEDDVRLRAGGPWKQAFIEIGDHSFIGHSTQVNVGNEFKIGRNCMIAPLCVFSDAHHEFIDVTIPMNQQRCLYNSIEVKDDVWMGSGCVILGGVTIGTGVVIAAGAVVNKSIPDYEIWGGVPAKKIKSRI
jgi:acetyltransferase-like isoleucine patch superfamily enzyme